MSAAVARTLITPAEYLTFERTAEFRHEFVGGEILAMAGGTPAHSLIAANLIREIGNALRGSACRTYTNDLRIAAPAGEMYTYPDLSVVCGEPQFDPADADTLINPTLLVEVLSPSTESWDRGGKFAYYRRIPSLKEYLLVSQDRPRVERYLRQGEDWLLTEFSGRDAVLTLGSVPAQVSLAEIYARVAFPENPPR